MVVLPLPVEPTTSRCFLAIASGAFVMPQKIVSWVQVAVSAAGSSGW
jgi:hypothetical protein